MNVQQREASAKAAVRVWEEDKLIPTYGVGEPDKNPMFLEKRVYQGSSGRVYPYPVIDKIYDEKREVSYRLAILENEYVVGLAGPWISGGIEFNWPQHHRPNTFGPVEYRLEQREDGSATVWVSEIDRMYGTKMTAGFTLYPGKAYLEISAQLYNRTPEPQTFLWWANPAVAVNDHTQSVFPPDVTAVFDHGKRDVSRFPIATGTYYKMDYSEGVDISRYKISRSLRPTWLTNPTSTLSTATTMACKPVCCMSPITTFPRGRSHGLGGTGNLARRGTAI